MSNGINYAQAGSVGRRAYETAERLLGSEAAGICRAAFDEVLGLTGASLALPKTPVVGSEAGVAACATTPAVTTDLGRRGRA